jgi:hypothetical protein
MFREDDSLDMDGHQRLFEFLEIAPRESLAASFSRTPRPDARTYFRNYDEIERSMKDVEGGVFAKYFAQDFDPRQDTAWPVLKSYRLKQVMAETDNRRFRRAA